MPEENTKKLAFIGILIASVIFISVFVIPYLVIPPEEIPRPTLAEGMPVEARHIDYLVKRLGAGRLLPVPGSGRFPVMEVLVIPANSYFTVTVQNGVATAKAGRASDPDIRLTGDREVVARLLSADDILAEVKRLNEEGKVTLEMLRDREELIMIGYESLYNELTN